MTANHAYNNCNLIQKQLILLQQHARPVEGLSVFYIRAAFSKIVMLFFSLYLLHDQRLPFLSDVASTSKC